MRFEFGGERKERDGVSAHAGVFIARQKRFSNHAKASEGTLPMEEAGVAVEVASAADTGDTGRKSTPRNARQRQDSLTVDVEYSSDCAGKQTQRFHSSCR